VEEGDVINRPIWMQGCSRKVAELFQQRVRLGSIAGNVALLRAPHFVAMKEGLRDGLPLVVQLLAVLIDRYLLVSSGTHGM
jgi:hypothetical protein